MQIPARLFASIYSIYESVAGEIETAGTYRYSHEHLLELKNSMENMQKEINEGAQMIKQVCRYCSPIRQWSLPATQC